MLAARTDILSTMFAWGHLFHYSTVSIHTAPVRHKAVTLYQQVMAESALSNNYVLYNKHNFPCTVLTHSVMTSLLTTSALDFFPAAAVMGLL